MERIINDIKNKNRKVVELKNKENFISKFMYKNNIKKLILLYNKLLDLIIKKESFNTNELLQLISLIKHKRVKGLEGIIDIRGDSLGFFNDKISIRYQIFRDSNSIKYNFYDNNNGESYETTYTEIKNALNFDKSKEMGIEDIFANVKIIYIIESYINRIVSKD